jgi:hypothetical protein
MYYFSLVDYWTHPSILNAPYRVCMSALLCTTHSFSFHRIYTGARMYLSDVLHTNRRDYMKRAAVGKQYRAYIVA